MSYRKQQDTKQQAPAAKVKKNSETNGKHSAETAAPDATMQRILRYVAAGNYQKAFDLLASAGPQPQFRNARGVCLMRLGRIDEAIRMYRDLVLHPGGTWTRPDLPTAYKTNFATALLLGGHPSGCMEVLDELKDEQHPSVQRLRAAIKRWRQSLSLWQKLNWWIGQIEPKNRPVQIDFVPGEFDIDVTTPDAPAPKTPGPNLRTAA